MSKLGTQTLAPVAFAMFLPVFQDQQVSFGLPWWAWLIILLLVILVVWWLISRQTKHSPTLDEHALEHAPEPDHQALKTETIHPVVETPPAAAAAEIYPEPAPVPVPAGTNGGAVADDLAVIEGIGPKIAGLLHDAGITSFNQLAATQASHLREILLSAGLRLNDPTTWPEQARLAAAGDWEALQRLQDSLKAGRQEPGATVE